MKESSIFKRRYIVLAVLLIALVLYFALGRSLKKAGLEGPYPCSYVIDGDTIMVSKDGREQKVRMIGIDAPESVHEDASKNVPEGETASAYMRELLEGKNVYLEYGQEDHDKYGRDLAYVYLEDGASMAEILILKAGYAQLMIVSPNNEHERELRRAQEDAKKLGLGFWGTGFYK